MSCNFYGRIHRIGSRLAVFQERMKYLYLARENSVTKGIGRRVQQHLQKCFGAKIQRGVPLGGR